MQYKSKLLILRMIEPTEDFDEKDVAKKAKTPIKALKKCICFEKLKKKKKYRNKKYNFLILKKE